jgi:Chitobiase/beta-hexosaminidase C-terminal domain
VVLSRTLHVISTQHITQDTFMPILIMNGGSWTTVSKIYIMSGGAWTQVQAVYILNGGAWTQAYAASSPPPPVPPVPTISPSGTTTTSCTGLGCPLTESATYTITCASGTIHYTTDGSAPITSSPTVASGGHVVLTAGRGAV